MPLAEVLAAEQDSRSRRRLRDILVGFGPKAADSIRPLMNAKSWEVRRTAAFLLREFGGAEGLKELVPLLADAEPLVQPRSRAGIDDERQQGSGRHPAERAEHGQGTASRGRCCPKS